VIPVEHHDGELLGAHAQGACGEITVEGGRAVRVRDRLNPDCRRTGRNDTIERNGIGIVETARTICGSTQGLGEVNLCTLALAGGGDLGLEPAAIILDELHRVGCTACVHDGRGVGPRGHEADADGARGLTTAIATGTRRRSGFSRIIGIIVWTGRRIFGGLPVVSPSRTSNLRGGHGTQP
jgi:hypothetical protein